MLVLEPILSSERDLVGWREDALEIRVDDEGDSLLIAKVAEFEWTGIFRDLNHLLKSFCCATVLRVCMECYFLVEVTQTLPAEELLSIVVTDIGHETAEILDPGEVSIPEE